MRGEEAVDARLRRARAAVLAVFFVHGAVFASWAARIPAVQEDLRLGSGALGVVLAGPALGSLAGSQLGGLLVDRIGSRRATAAAVLALCVPTALIPLAGSAWSLLALLVVLGVADGGTAVAMNAQGVAVQDRYGRPLLNGMHATRSIGAVAGGLAAAGTVAFGLPLAVQFPLTAAVLLLVAAVATRWLPTVPRRAAAAAGRSKGRVRLAVLLLALVAFLAALVEDAPASWSGVYLRHVGATEAVAAAGYAVFSAGEVVSRLLNDRLVGRFGWAAVVRAGTLACALALTTALLLGRVDVTLVALALAGAGISAVFPATFAAAGAVPGPPGVALAQVNVAGSLGWLTISPAVGGLAVLASLPLALGLLPAAALGIALLAPAALAVPLRRSGGPPPGSR